MAHTTMKTARKARLLRQCDLAILLDVSMATVCRWEKGTHTPSPEQQVKLAAHLAMPRTELFPAA